MNSNSKKRKITRNSARSRHQDKPPSPTIAADTILPSCEADDDTDTATFSFSAASNSSFSANPRESASSLPPRLQTRTSFVSAADNASSTASSPCAAALAEVSIDSDRGGEASGTESGTAPRPTPARSRSPIKYAHRSIMSGDGDLQRSSSPLKRRASSMDAENHEDDVDMVGPQQPNGTGVSTRGLPRAMSVDAPDGPGYGQNADGIPPVPEQLKILQTLQAAFNERPVAQDDAAFVVSKSWVERGLALGADPKLAKKGLPDQALGPVDNSDIVLEVIQEPNNEPFVRLRPGTDLGVCELFCEDAWNLIHKWYGLKDGQFPIRRTAVNTQADDSCPPNIEYELHPPVFRIHRLWSLHSGIDIPENARAQKSPPLIMVRSRGYRFHDFLREVKRALQINFQIEVRLWEVERTTAEPLPIKPLEPITSTTNPQDAWQSLYLDITKWSELDYNRRVKIEAADSTRNPKYNGKSRLSVYDLTCDKTLVVEESIGDDGWVSTKTSLASRPNRAPRPANISTQSRGNSGRGSPALPGPVTRGRTLKKQKGWKGSGAVGLHNLGNTCYMNSALQCVRSVEELTKYFLTDEFTEEINDQNHLGYSGKMAIAYGTLLKDMYHTANDSVRPSNFKSTAGSCRSTFASWGQQDSQEFLGFLLDALQEDLSRVKKKPYIEKPDSTDDMVDDEEAIAKMADEVWSITMKRDDSVISDLFTGLYKSTLKCPVCHKISITFDPFNNLTLPLPIENPWAKAVKFYPLNDVPVEIEVDIPQHSGVDVLKRFISDKTGVPMERLMGAEEFKCKFFKIYDDTMDVSDEIGSSDVPAVHEVEVQPSNWPPKPVVKPKQQAVRSMLDVDSPQTEEDPFGDPGYDQMVVPVVHRRDSRQASTRSYMYKDTGLPPHFIVLNREEARNLDIIRRKILEKVATFTTWAGFAQDDGRDTADNTDAEMALASDADSGDSKLVAKSVEGEDDMVDVSMSNVKPTPATSPGVSKASPSSVLRQFNTRRPKWMDPDEFLHPELQNMFEMGYFSDAKGADNEISTGWTSVDDHKVFPLLSDRIPDPPTPIDQESPGQSGWANGNASDNDSGSDEIQNSISESGQTRMVEESDDDEDVVSFKHKGSRGNASRAKHTHKVGATAGRGRQGKNKKTYAKKDRQRFTKARRGNKHSQQASFQAPEVAPQHRMAAVMPDDAPGLLIRLGEGIIVDWTDSAWNMLFDSQHGTKTFVDLEKLRDPALEHKRKQRSSRRTTGISLDDCLDEFERAEILSEHDMWYCPRCKEHRRASKKFDLWKTPDILVCHLKRFSSSHYRRDKIDVKVNFPVEGLDLESRVLRKEDGKVEVYDLIGVDEHFGGLGGGHYTASAKNFIDGKWYHYNDSSVSTIKDPESQVVSAAAYLLFYRRRSSEPLGGTRFGEIFKTFSHAEEEEEEDAEMAASGDEHAVGGSSLYGLSTAGKEAGAGVIHLRTSGASASVTAGSGGGEDPPAYQSAVQNSIEEDEGIEMGVQTATTGSASAYATGWSFSNIDATINGNGKGKQPLVDYDSDNAQQDSGSERGSLPPLNNSYTLPDAPGGEEPPDYYEEPEPPIEPLLADNAIEWDLGGSSYRRDEDQDSSTVAEIHLDDNSKEAGRDAN